MPKCFQLYLLIFALSSLHTQVFCVDVVAYPDGAMEQYNINSSISVNIAYRVEPSEFPFRVIVKSVDATSEYPLLVVVRQEKRVTSWQIPMQVETRNPLAKLGLVEFQSTARTLCTQPHMFVISRASTVKEPKTNFTVSLSTFSDKTVTVLIRVVTVQNYYLKSDVAYETTFSPGQPVYFAYHFENSNVKTVSLKIASNDDVCFTVSVQPNICPIYDLNDEISYQGKYQTVNRRGGLVIYRSQFSPFSSNSFVVAFVAKADNYECDVQASLPVSLMNVDVRRQHNKQVTKVQFMIKTAKKDGEYAIAIFALLGFNVALCVLIFILTYLFYRFGHYYKVKKDDYEMPLPFIEPSPDQVDQLQENPEPKVSDFIYHGKRNQRKSLNYFWHICNIGIFYGLPVIQLMIFYQRVVNYSGDLDLCYYNSQCSHPLYFTDFNHVYSNIGYVLFGLLFLGITGFRHIKVHNKHGKGIPKLYGQYYAMGVALTFEGFLSGCYHICPNQSNFQFDTSFMYVMAVLIMAKLYQNRHPDTQASAYSTFSILGVSVVVAMFGILYNSVAVIILFFICYVCFTAFLSLKLYFFTNAGQRLKQVYITFKSSGNVTDLTPIRTQLFVFIVLANIFNFMLAVGGFFLYPKYLDFGTYLLMILMGNAILHSIFYTSMKLVKKEHICFEAILYGLLAILLWAGGSYFFFNSATQWSTTPAQSRLLNQDCMILDFYDTHDIWHIMSAPALFFSFLFLMALDDDLHDTPRDKIIVF